jgi:hypothetical protein
MAFLFSKYLLHPHPQHTAFRKLITNLLQQNKGENKERRSGVHPTVGQTQKSHVGWSQGENRHRDQEERGIVPGK